MSTPMELLDLAKSTIQIPCKHCGVSRAANTMFIFRFGDGAFFCTLRCEMDFLNKEDRDGVERRIEHMRSELNTRCAQRTLVIEKAEA